MNAVDFSTFADDLIRQLSPHLADLASAFHRDQGRGAVEILLHDDDSPEGRTSNIGYKPHDKLDKHGRDLTAHYDPTRALVLLIRLDQMAMYRAISFSDLARWRAGQEQAVPTAEP
jgi:hypothetical protein